MGFGFAGAAAGASDALEKILAKQMLDAQMAQRQQEAAARLRLDETRLNAQLADADEDRKFRQRQEERADAKTRSDNNRVGVRRMIGESLTQRTGPMSPEDRRSIAALQVEAGDLPDMSLLSDPTPKMRSVTVRGPKGEPINRMVPETESVEEYREPKSTGGGTTNYLTLTDGKGNQQRVPDGPQANRLLQQGWRLFDAVAERSSKPVNAAEAQDTAREAARLAGELIKHPGLGGAFGVVSSALPTMRQSTADAEVLRDSLTSLLTVENMSKMKGVLSDSDMKILRAASSTINPRMGDAAARAELKRIVEVMTRAAGDSPMPSMDLATSRGNVAAPVDDPVAALIKKYGGR